MTVVLLLVYYFGYARARFQGPRIMGEEAELTELEREFEHAAEELGAGRPRRRSHAAMRPGGVGPMAGDRQSAGPRLVV